MSNLVLTRPSAVYPLAQHPVYHKGGRDTEVVSKIMWGVNGFFDFTSTSTDTDLQVQRMRDLGVQFIRVPFKWDTIEGTEGTYVWNNTTWPYATWMPAARKYNLPVVACIYSVPSWATFDAPDTSNSKLPNATALTAFIKVLMARYSGMFDSLQIMNEEATSSSWRPDRAASRYVSIMQSVYPVVKAIDPLCKVITAGLWSQPTGWLEEFYEAGGLNYYDVLDLHYYSFGDAPDTIPAGAAGNTGNVVLNWYLRHIHETMKRYNQQDKPIWMLEWGWARTNEGNPAAVTSPANEVAYLDYLMRNVMRSGIISRCCRNYLIRDDGLSLVHKTALWAGSTAQPNLNGAINASVTSLTTATWADDRWPDTGVLTIDSEEMSYTAFASNVASGLTRGINGTSAASHADATQVLCKDLTTLFARSNYDRFKEIARNHQKVTRSHVGNLPDVPNGGPATLTILNADFETAFVGGNPPNWSNNGSPGRTGESTIVHSGTQSMKAQKTSTATASGGFQANVVCSGGKSYVATCWYYQTSDSGAACRVDFYVQCRNDADTVLTTPHGAEHLAPLDDKWHQARFAFVTPTDTTKLTVWCVLTGPATADGDGVAYFDDLAIEPYELN